MLSSQLTIISIYSLLLLQIPFSNSTTTITTNHSLQQKSYPLFKFHHQQQRHLVTIDDDYEYEEDDDDDYLTNQDDGVLENQDIILESCTPITQCELCPGYAAEDDEQGHSYSGCAMTGKHIRMRCKLNIENAVGSDVELDEKLNGGGDWVSLYTSCKRTTMDEEYLMMQLQAICSFIAFFSLRSVRREKLASASLFELRSRRRIRQQEMTPLTTNNNNNNNNNGDSVTTDGGTGNEMV